MYTTKIKIHILQEYAKQKKGFLVSLFYRNSKQLLEWQCEKGHIWKASWSNIHKKFRPTWCPICSKVSKPLLSTILDYAKQKNGLCLSTKYLNNRQKLLWQCDKEHQWSATWNDVSSKNSWCPLCKRLKNESLCVTSVETLLGISFLKTRIYYDSSNKKSFFELDGYNKVKKIAVEYQGIQHYKYVKLFHSNGRSLELQQKQDAIKKQYCRENNIILLEIPYTVNNISDFIINTYKEELHGY